VTFKGWQEIADQFRNLPGFDDGVQNALLNVGERMVETAMQLVRVRTGRLRALSSVVAGMLSWLHVQRMRFMLSLARGVWLLSCF
jgi:hypothetical protein